MHLKVNDKLVQDAAGRAAMTTHSGMAPFAGTGPAGKTCRECVFWRFQGHKKTDRTPKNSACQKGLGAKFPHSAAACKYFEQSENPPAAKLRDETLIG